MTVVLSMLFRLPYSMLKYILPSQRPKQSWSYRATLNNWFLLIYFSVASKIRIKTPRVLDGGKEKSVFTLIEPGPKVIYKGALSSSTVNSRPVGSIWVPKRFSGDQTDPVVLHCHGGAYVLLSARLPLTQSGPRLLFEELRAATVLCPEYRLASNPGCTFPAQLQDAVSTYHFLLNDQKIKPSNIILSGDSAGGHNVIGFLRYLQQNPGVLPLPKAALLHSPWVNLTPSGTNVDSKPNADSDYIPTAFLEWGAQAFTPEGIQRDSEFISPLYHPFPTEVPIWVQVGTAEVLYGDVLGWVDKMRSIKGNIIGLHEVKDAMHNPFAVGSAWDMDDLARGAIRDAKMFINQI